MVNMDVLEAALTQIKDHPETHYQAVWTCGTSACLAGHIAYQQGWKYYSNAYLGYTVEKYGRLRSVTTIAREALDLDVFESSVLFNGKNTVETMEQMAKDLANGDSLGSLWKRNPMGVYCRIETDDH